MLTLGDLLVEEMKRKDMELFSEHAKTCKDHYGRICVNNDAHGILCNYANCPHKALKGEKRDQSRSV
jgi:hypothetical protein